MNNNDIAVSCKSLRRVRQRSPTAVFQGTTTQEFDTTMTAESTYVDFQGKINDCDVVEDEQMKAVKRVERRRAARRNGAARSSRPDANGRINGKECHAFAFAAMFEEDIADEL